MAARIEKGASVLLLAAMLGCPGRALAQSGDPAAAEALFAAGRAAFESGNFEAACAKFAESHRLDPAAGTVINLAACNESRGRLASAWENWREALSMLRVDDERRPGVEKRKGDLEARLPRLVVRLAPSAPPGSEVSRDGVALGPAALGLPLPVDPGPHRVEVKHLDRAPRAYEVTATEGHVSELVVEAGPALARAIVPAAKPLAPEPRRERTGPDGARLAGYIAGGVGVAGVGVGAVTGLLALDRKRTIEDSCEKRGDRYACPPEGVDAAKSGDTLATVSSIATISGLALLAGGVVLVLTSHDGPDLTATVLPNGGMIGGRGRF